MRLLEAVTLKVFFVQPADGRTDWDDYLHHRANFLDPARIEQVEAIWRLPAAEPAEEAD